MEMQMDGKGILIVIIIGVLTEPSGKYTGSFRDNHKHGKGTY